jgi:hypothetical protein
MTSLYSSGDAIDQLFVVSAGPVTAGERPPQPVVEWLGALRLLEGVPFAYLVVDEAFLPEESIRFFYVDRNWTDAAVDGALSVGASTTRERAHLQARHQRTRDAVDASERKLRAQAVAPGLTLSEAKGETVTGFLLRSRAVSGWPGLHVRAFRTGGEVRLLRVERLAPAVLLVLFDGLPQRVTIEEPRQSLQFGFDMGANDARVLAVRDETTWDAAGEQLDVRFRPSAPGVLDVADLASRLGSRAENAAELARQLMQLPFRNVFSGPPGPAVFSPTITLADLDASFQEDS